MLAFLSRDDDAYTCDHYYSLDSLLLYRVALVSYRSSFLCSPDLCRNYLARSKRHGSSEFTLARPDSTRRPGAQQFPARSLS